MAACSVLHFTKQETENHSESQCWKVKLHVSRQTSVSLHAYSGGVLLQCASHSAHLLSTIPNNWLLAMVSCTFLIGGEKLLSCIYPKHYHW